MSDPRSSQIVSEVYLDVSALGRPFDQQDQLRIQLEADAVLLIVAHVASGAIRLALSSPLWYEVSANPIESKREPILDVLTRYGVFLGSSTDAVKRRWEYFVSDGITDLDALHVAIAEEYGYDFVSCDDRLLRKVARLGLSIWSGTPLAYCEREELR